MRRRMSLQKWSLKNCSLELGQILVGDTFFEETTELFYATELRVKQNVCIIVAKEKGRGIRDWVGGGGPSLITIYQL